jgi:hypothetical protein
MQNASPHYRALAGIRQAGTDFHLKIPLTTDIHPLVSAIPVQKSRIKIRLKRKIQEIR